MSDEASGLWNPHLPLFPSLTENVRHILEAWPEILKKVWPLNSAHRKSLPHDIAELSEILTCKRREMEVSYWSRPAFISAYLYYFLPWNLVRLARILPGLPISSPANLNNPLLLDAGSGPLTLPLALWLVKPEWRGISIHIMALDTRKQPMELGARLYSALTETIGTPAWKIHLAQAPVYELAKKAAPLLKNSTAWLVSCVNTLNELAQSGVPKRYRHETMTESDDPERGDMTFLERILETMRPLWGQAPQILFVEPGTRLGGKTIMNMRKLALEDGLSIVSPCLHNHGCPLSRKGHWCHFTFSAADAPGWLQELSREAGLCKKSLSLSCIFLSAGKPACCTKESASAIEARVISQPFEVPDLAGLCRYACFNGGLALLENARIAPSGCIVNGTRHGKDEKSGAIILKPTTAQACASNGSRRKHNGKPGAKRKGTA